MVTPDKESALLGEKYLNGYHISIYGSLPRASKYPGRKKSEKIFENFKK